MREMTRNPTGDVVGHRPLSTRRSDDDGPHWPDTQDANRPSKRGSE